jgi:hypothetical protein
MPALFAAKMLQNCHFRWTNRGVTQSLIESLPAAVAVVLIIVMCILLTGGILLFTYKVGMESKDAVMAFKSLMQSCGGAAPGTLSRWVEDNKIPQYIDSHSNKAYNILVHKVDEIAAKNNMTELVNAVKELLSQIAEGGTATPYLNGKDSTEDTSLPGKSEASQSSCTHLEH